MKGTTFFCLTIGISLLAGPAIPIGSHAQGPKSELQKKIQRESQERQKQKDRQERDRINNDLKKQGDWRKKYGSTADSATTQKANDRTRELYERKQQIERRNNPPKERPTAQTGSANQQNKQEQKALERDYRTFGKGDNTRQPRR